MKRLIKIIVILMFAAGCLPNNLSLVKSNESDIYVKLVPGSGTGIVAYISVPSETEDLTVCINDSKCEAKSGLNGVQACSSSSDRKIFKMDKEFSSTDTLTIVRGIQDAVRRTIKLEGKKGISVDIADISKYMIDLPVVRNTKQSGWGDVLTDVIQHYLEPGSACLAYTSYHDGEQPTYAHEATHGLNACIGNKYGSGSSVYGFYLLGGKGIYVKNPSMHRSKVASVVPSSLRNLDGTNRYNTYITNNSVGSSSPLYIFDEWVAYANGSREAINMLDNGKSVGATVKLGAGVVEFAVYATAAGLALERNEESYLKQEPKFIALYKHVISIVAKDIITSKHQQVIDSETRSYWNKFKTDNSAQELRSWIKRNCGEDWAKETLGI